MADDKRINMNDGWTVSKKGWDGAPGKVQGGYTGPTGTLGTPPTGGSGVTKPVDQKKD